MNTTKFIKLNLAGEGLLPSVGDNQICSDIYFFYVLTPDSAHLSDSQNFPLYNGLFIQLPLVTLALVALLLSVSLEELDKLQQAGEAAATDLPPLQVGWL